MKKGYNIHTSYKNYPPDTTKLPKQEKKKFKDRYFTIDIKIIQFAICTFGTVFLVELCGRTPVLWIIILTSLLLNTRIKEVNNNG